MHLYLFTRRDKAAAEGNQPNTLRQATDPAAFGAGADQLDVAELHSILIIQMQYTQPARLIQRQQSGGDQMGRYTPGCNPGGGAGTGHSEPTRVIQSDLHREAAGSTVGLLCDMADHTLERA